ncbi:MAG: response regulator [Chitinispirillaceae bacterium]|nr:response regulator [Chitinispirillaceae bacterium]
MRMDPDVGLMARIIEHTPIGIVILRIDRTIRYVNSLAAHLLNCDRESLLDTSVDPFIVDRPNEIPWLELWQLVARGTSNETVVGIARRESEEITCALTAFHIGGRETQDDAIALVFRDITHEVRIAEQLETKNNEMAKMNTELIRSNVELKRVSEMKSNFLSIASHELKTPLTSIKGYSDIIIDGMRERVDPGIFRMIESINRAADRLHTIINNILDVTRIEQKKIRLRPEKFSLATLARDCVEECAQLAEKRSITFNCYLAHDMPLFYGDKMRMHQVFINLFSNAVKYSPDGAAVEVSIQIEEDTQFHIRVSDRGIGIDKSEHKRIFDSFYEVGDISKHSTDHIKFMGSGMGLGLSIAKGLVVRHGGRIWVESEGVRPNDYLGSTFHVLLPIRSEMGWDDIEKIMDPKVAVTVKKTAEAEEHGDRKPTMLLIDSDREVVEVARMVLENAFDILNATTGEQGLSLAFQYKPSAILLDASLSGLDGYRTCSILRSQDETRDIPIIFLSAITSQSEIERCFSSGADDFIIKPFSGRELMDKLWRLLLKKKEEAVK